MIYFLIALVATLMFWWITTSAITLVFMGTIFAATAHNADPFWPLIIGCLIGLPLVVSLGGIPYMLLRWAMKKHASMHKTKHTQNPQ